MFVMNQLEPGLTIKAVAERTGISEHVLRAWERRYNIPQPQRHRDNRYRLYAEQDVADVLWLKQQIQAGLKPAQASLLFQQQRSARVATLAAPSPLAARRDALRAALLKPDELGARKILDEAFALVAPEQVALDITQPALVEIGDKWMRNEIGVWHEHLASNIVRKKMFAVFHAQMLAATHAPTLVAACAPREDHEIGLLTVALLAQRQNWRVHYLGQRTPLAETIAAARATKPTWVAVSVSTVIGLASVLPWLEKAQRPGVPLIFGGRLLKLVPVLRERLPGECLTVNGGDALRALHTLQPRARLWSPPKRAWDAAMALQVQQHTIAVNVANLFFERLSSRARRAVHLEDATEITEAGLHLAHALVCACALDAPEILDLEKAFLDQAMPPRAVSPEMLATLGQLFAKSLQRALDADHARQFNALLARWNGTG